MYTMYKTFRINK